MNVHCCNWAMKKLKHAWFIWIVVLLSISGCDPNPDPAPPIVNIHFKSYFGNTSFDGTKVYQDGLGHRIRIDYFYTYFSNIKLIKSDGSAILVKDFALFNMDSDPVLSLNIESSEIARIEFAIGIPEEYNKDVDPTTYANSHPLSVQGSQGMFWTWNTGYIFSKMEGKADLTGTEGASLTNPFAYHAGDDPLYRTLSFEKPFTIAANESQDIIVSFHLDEIFNNADDPIDVSTDYITHTTDNFPLAERFINNLAASIEVH